MTTKFNCKRVVTKALKPKATTLPTTEQLKMQEKFSLQNRSISASQCQYLNATEIVEALLEMGL